ncbi:MAG TPA: DUF6337 family protein [Longimicrobiales bacterium]|nr:DUF6337 family protein [Longimicrobiales bacterium]
MTALLALVLLACLAVGFSRLEEELWGTRRTPFAFVAYPFLVVLALSALVGPALGYRELSVPALGTVGLLFALLATASVALHAVRPAAAPAAPVGPAPLPAPAPPPAQEPETGPAPPPDERRIPAWEYLLVAALMAVLFVPELLSGVAVEKGGLGVGTYRSHLVQLGMAYLLLAAAQSGGAVLPRLLLAVLVLWMLAFNQVKYLIFLPLAGALLFRWASGRLSTWTIAVISVSVPVVILLVVYVFFGAAAGRETFQLSPGVVLEMARRTVSYLLSGVTGLTLLLRDFDLDAFGTEGLSYAFGPAVNVFRFATGNPDYVTFVNPLYLHIDTRGSTSNVFTLFGSFLYRGGWSAAVTWCLAYAVVCYLVWDGWRRRRNALDAAAGSWWLAPLLFAWFDPFFVNLSIWEVTVILWLRARLP